MNMTTVSLVARHWPLATKSQAKRQAIRLIRARQYLRNRGIEAAVTGSTFSYSSAPQVLA